MQDRSPPARQNPLATHGRTIHWVKPGNTRCEQMTSALPLTTDITKHKHHVRKVPLSDLCTAAMASLFNHLVGTPEQRKRYG